MKKRVITASMALLSLLMLCFPSSSAEAASSLTVILHKKGFVDTIDTEIKNEGQMLDPSDPIFQEAVGVNGVDFTVYNVTEEYHKALAEGKEINNIKAEMAQRTKEELAALNDLIVAEGTTAPAGEEEGVLAFDLAIQEGKSDTAYLIVETGSETSDSESSQSMLLVINDDFIGQTLHLYPKNILLDKPELPGTTAPDPSGSTEPDEVPRSRLPRTSGASSPASSQKKTGTKGKLPSTNDLRNTAWVIGGAFIFFLGMVLLYRQRLREGRALDEVVDNKDDSEDVH